MKRIGLVMDFFRMGIGEGAAAYARAHGLRIDPRWSIRGDWMSSRPEWDGVIAMVVDMPDLEKRLGELNLPMVLLGPMRHHICEGQPLVMTDYHACGAMAFRELAENGVDRLVVVTAGTREIDKETAQGFIEEAAKSGMPALELPMWGKDTKTGTKDLEVWVSEIVDQLESLPRPTGIFLAHAGVAYSLLSELERRGLRVPEDFPIIVIQKDAQGTAQMASVPLTTVEPDTWQQGYFAAGLLDRHFKGDPLVPAIHRIPPTGVTRRDSTGVQVIRDQAVVKTMHFIRERYASGIKVDQLARISGVSRRSLEERFRREMGISIHDALTRRRMEVAKQLLRSSEVPLAEIADMCGYGSVHYFTTVFKKMTGENPGQFRKLKTRS